MALGRLSVSSRISSPKDFWTGLIYVAFGAVALWLGANYNMGTAGRMGPGYFPKVLAAILIVLGTISVARSFVSKGAPVEPIALKPLVLLLLASALFGLLINRAGLIVALLALVLVSAAASREFKFSWSALLGLVGLVVFCALVFVKGLGVPMPIIGTWLEPYAGPLMPYLR
jgi:hypothetical protein